MRVYYALGRVLSPVLTRLFWVYNRMARGVRPRALLVNSAGEILLVRSWTGDQRWELPGGGKGRNETPVQAVQRELHEELGVLLPLDTFEYVGTAYANGYKAPVYTAFLEKDFSIAHNKWEISGYLWCAPYELPSSTGPVLRWALENDVQKTNNLL